MILQSSDTQVPPGFEAVEEQNGWTLHQNRYATPLGVVYPESISAVQTGEFSSVERQQLALRTAALNGLSGSVQYVWVPSLRCMHVTLLP